VIDVSTPANPTEAGFVDTPDWAQSVAVSGGFAYVADGITGLRVIDVSDPASPAEEGFADTAGYAMGVAAAEGHVYLASQEAGIYVFLECGAGIFSDGFESGDTSAWSVTQP
jgi:hypothetical protein